MISTSKGAVYAKLWDVVNWNDVAARFAAVSGS
ncbi:superoxide dismutase [Kitasatospora sp. MAP12-15]|nr:superoxide dismutase [Kitasatospora sp. MAP12-44]